MKQGEKREETGAKQGEDMGRYKGDIGAELGELLLFGDYGKIGILAATQGGLMVE